MEVLAPYEECPTILSCYAWDVWQFIDWRSIAIGTCFWIAAMTIAYFRGQVGDVKRIFIGALQGTTVTLAAIGLLLFAFIIYSPWQRYATLKEYAEGRGCKVERRSKSGTIEDRPLFFSSYW
jgi:hypothetical protein